MLEVRIRDLGKSYTPGVPVLKPIDLDIPAGEKFFLLGPSGCGKSTLLRIIAGLLEPSSGKIFFNGRDVTGTPPEKRCAPMVFQNYALWPNMTVAENVAFALKAAGRMDAAALRRRVAEALDTVRMGEFASRKPGALSGGQQQRVALARCLALEPELLLLDEPLSNLDARLRDEMRGELSAIFHKRQLTAIYVTHDRKEALSMADRIAVLHEGGLEQVGTPMELYRSPATRFVASFLGDANLLSAVYSGSGKVRALGREFEVASVPEGLAAGSSVTLFFRPEAVRFGEGGLNSFTAELESGQFSGEWFHWQFKGGVAVNEAAAPERKIGSAYTLSIAPDQLRILTR